MTNLAARILNNRIAASTGVAQPRKPQVKLTVIVNDRSGGIIPQVILIPGETQLHQLDEAVRKAVIEQTVHDGTCIMKVTYTP